MKQTFKEFYNPDYQNLWETCTFVFDTNVLLDLYRYKGSTKDTFFKVLEKIGDNKWLPYQVGYEYHKNRQNVRMIQPLLLVVLRKILKKSKNVVTYQKEIMKE